jgi:hypothetical protein
MNRCGEGVSKKAGCRRNMPRRPNRRIGVMPEPQIYDPELDNMRPALQADIDGPLSPHHPSES